MYRKFVRQRWMIVQNSHVLGIVTLVSQLSLLRVLREPRWGGLGSTVVHNIWSSPETQSNDVHSRVWNLLVLICQKAVSPKYQTTSCDLELASQKMLLGFPSTINPSKSMSMALNFKTDRWVLFTKEMGSTWVAACRRDNSRVARFVTKVRGLALCFIWMWHDNLPFWVLYFFGGSEL